MVIMAMALKSNVLASIAPLVCSSLAELVREVVVVKVHTIVVVVVILPILLAVHVDLHGLTAPLKTGDQEHTGYWNGYHAKHRARGQETVEKALHELHEGHSLKAVLRVEVDQWVDSRVVDSTAKPRW